MTKIRQIIIEALLFSVIFYVVTGLFKHFERPLDLISVIIGYCLCVSSHIIRDVFDKYNKNK